MTPYSLDDLNRTANGKLEPYRLLTTLRPILNGGGKHTVEGQAILAKAAAHLRADPEALLVVISSFLDGFLDDYYWRSTPIAIKEVILTTKIPLKAVKIRRSDFELFAVEGLAYLNTEDAERWWPPNYTLYPEYVAALVNNTHYGEKLYGEGCAFIGSTAAETSPLRDVILCGLTIEQITPFYPKLAPLFEQFIQAIHGTYDGELRDDNSVDQTQTRAVEVQAVTQLAKEVAQAYIKQKSRERVTAPTGNQTFR